MPEQ
jgi:hypothetical protein